MFSEVLRLCICFTINGYDERLHIRNGHLLNMKMFMSRKCEEHAYKNMDTVKELLVVPQHLRCMSFNSVQISIASENNQKLPW